VFAAGVLQPHHLTIRLKPDATAKELIWELSKLFLQEDDEGSLVLLGQGALHSMSKVSALLDSKRESRGHSHHRHSRAVHSFTHRVLPLRSQP
jgi:hypothetical protein